METGMTAQDHLDNLVPEKMNPEIKTQWLEALRSGAYTQAQGELIIENGNMCCLGVLCDLFHKANPGRMEWVPDQKALRLSDADPIAPFSSHIPPKEVCDWAGLTDSNPTIPENNYDTLAEHNDGGKTFLEIADYIEKYL